MKAITVSQVNTYVKALLDENVNLKSIFVVGEISNFVHYYRSGHMYFTLKDDSSQLKAVMFSFSASRLKFMPEDGMRVVCRGRISVYEKDGQYQLYVDDMQPDGIGALNLAFEQLKERLGKEGLFDETHKKTLPAYPRKIGVATSDIGAAIEDIKNITKRRYPLCEIVICPTIVQGDAAPDDIVKSISILDSMEDIDLIIVGRGGGSIEDLWAFNTEVVARAVYNARKPIISAVGHEVDFTICDFVADLRAPTPSAAAELAVPDVNELVNRLNMLSGNMSVLINTKLSNELLRLDRIIEAAHFGDSTYYFMERIVLVTEYQDRLIKRLSSLLSDKKYSLSALAGKLNSLSPLGILSRGYALVEDESGLVRNVGSLNVNDKISINMNNGQVKCTVDEVILNG